LCEELFAEEMQELANGSQPQRLGVSGAALRHIGEVEAKDRARSLLLDLMDESDVEVRSRVSHVFGGKHTQLVLADADFCQAYTGSAAFRHAPYPLVRALEEQPDLLPCASLLFAVCRVFWEELADSSDSVTSRLGYTAGKLIPLIRRLYEQATEAGEQQVVQQCLDQIDHLAEKRVGWCDVLAELAS